MGEVPYAFLGRFPGFLIFFLGFFGFYLVILGFWFFVFFGKGSRFPTLLFGFFGEVLGRFLWGGFIKHFLGRFPTLFWGGSQETLIFGEVWGGFFGVSIGF